MSGEKIEQQVQALSSHEHARLVRVAIEIGDPTGALVGRRLVPVPAFLLTA